MSVDSSVETFEYDKLIAGITHRVTETRVKADLPATAGEWKRGTVMALDETTGKLVRYLASDTNRDACYGILAEDITFGAAEPDRSVVVYLTGQFNQDALVFEGAGTLTAALRADARLKGCFFEDVGNNDSTRYV